MSEPTDTDYIAGGRRCAIRRAEALPGWWVATSPRNGDEALVEGSWDDWVTLARSILALEGTLDA